MHLAVCFCVLFTNLWPSSLHILQNVGHNKKSLDTPGLKKRVVQHNLSNTIIAHAHMKTSLGNTQKLKGVFPTMFLRSRANILRMKR